MIIEPNEFSKFKGQTHIYLIVSDWSYNGKAMLLLDGELICKGYSTTDACLDSFVSSQVDNNYYSNKFFPNYHDEFFDTHEIENFLSVPFDSIINLSIIDHIYKNEDEYWNPDFDDLDSDGKKLFEILSNNNKDKELNILTFIKEETFH